MALRSSRISACRDRVRRRGLIALPNSKYSVFYRSCRTGKNADDIRSCSVFPRAADFADHLTALDGLSYLDRRRRDHVRVQSSLACRVVTDSGRTIPYRRNLLLRDLPICHPYAISKSLRPVFYV